MLAGCSGEQPKSTADNIAGDTPQDAKPEIGPTPATPATKPTATGDSTAASSPSIVAPGQPDAKFLTVVVPLPPGASMENESPIAPATPGAPPQAIARGHVIGPSGQRMIAYRMPDGQVLRVVGIKTTPDSVVGSPSSQTGIAALPNNVASAAIVEPDLTVPLPGEADGCAIGGFGRYLLLSFHQLQKVGVFDLRAGKILKYLNVDGDKFSVAGGATQFVIVNHTNLKLEAWKYDSLEQPRLQNTLTIDNRKKILGAVMGFAADGPLGITLSRTNYDDQSGFVDLFDVATLAPLEYAVDWKGHSRINFAESDAYSVTASPDGKSFNVARNGNVDTMTYDGTSLALKTRETSTRSRSGDSSALMSLDGAATFTNRQVTRGDGRTFMVQPRGGGTLLSTYPGRYWLTTTNIEENGEHRMQMEFFLTEHSQSFGSLRMKSLPLPFRASSLKIGNQKSIFYNSDEKTLVVIHADRRTIFVKRLDCDDMVKKSETPVLYITSEPPREFVPGQKLEYVMQALSNRGGVTYQLEAGPAGMTVSPQGKCEWTPSLEVLSRQTAIVVVKDQVGTQVFHNITLARGELPAFEVTVDGKAADPKELRVAIRLPAPASDFVVGGGGRYMLAVIASKRQLAVIDVKERRILKLLPIDDDVKVAGGATKFVVYSGKGTLSRWNFAKLERELTVACASRVESIAMGSASEGPLLISARGNPSCHAEFYELSTLKPAGDIDFVGYQRRPPLIEEYTAAAANGQTFVSWRRNTTPKGILSYAIRGEQSLAFNRHESAGPITPSPDGSTLYTALGECPSRGPESGHLPDAFRDGRRAARIGLPAASGSFYLAWPVGGDENAPREVTLHAQGDTNPILTVPAISPPGPIKSDDEDPLFSRRLLYVPDADAIVQLGPGLESLIVHRFSFEEELAKLKTDYLFVTSIPPQELRPSTKMNYQINAKSSKGALQYKLSAGPPGAQISPTGLVTWTVGASLDGTHPFSITVTDAAGTETVHAFAVLVDKHAVGSKTSATVPSTTTTAELIDVGRPKKVVALPGAIQRLCVGGGGRYLVGVIPKLRQIAVIDVVERKLQKLIPADDDDLRVAAGATKFVVSMGTKGVFTRYSLPGCERELTTAAPPQLEITSLTMGCNSEGPVFARARNSYEWPLLFLDLKNLKPIALKSENERSGYQLGTEIACSADSRFFVCGSLQANFADAKIQVASSGRVEGPAVGFGLPSADGRVVYSPSGIWKVGGNRVDGDKNSGVNIPAAIGPLFARIPMEKSRTKQVSPTLHAQGDDRPLLTIEDVEATRRNDNKSGGPDPLRFNAERFFLLPSANAICTLDEASDKVNIFRFNLDEELKKAAIDYLFVVSTAPALVHPTAGLSYQLDVRSKRGDVKYRLDAGPLGLTISPTGLITWTPNGADPEEKVVVVAISDASDQGLFHTFKLRVDAAAPKETAVGTTFPKSNLASSTGTPLTPTTPPVVEPAPLPAAAEITSPSADRMKQTLKLPAPIDDVCVGGGGRFLVVKLSSLKQCAIIDVAAKKVVTYLTVDDDEFQIAAGNTKLVVGMSSKSVLTRYELATGTRELSVPYAGKSISTMAMGSSSEGPLFIGHRDRDDNLPTFVDLRTLKSLNIVKDEERDISYGFATNVRVSADGTLFGSWSTGVSPSGLHLVALNGNKLKYYNEHDSVGAVLPSHDARVVYTGRGLYTPTAKPLNGESKRSNMTGSPVPAASGPSYLFFRIGSLDGTTRNAGKNSLTLHMQGEPLPIMSVEGIELPPIERNFHPSHIGRLKLDKQILLLPIAGAIVTLPMPGDTVFIHRFDLDEELRRCEIDYLFVASVPPAAVKAGTLFQYQVEGKSKRGGIKYRLESGPTGMTISPTGLVTWKAVRSGETEETAIIGLSDASGQDTFHTFKVRVDNGTGGSSTPTSTPTPSPSGTK